jgi:hypothetical protein
VDDTKAINLVGEGGKFLSAELRLWEEDPEQPDRVKLELRFNGRTLESSEDDFFSALNSIRKDLEKEGLIPEVYGASLHVYPSPMSRSMGAGEKAYKLTVGKQALTKDIVSIFETGPDVVPATLEQQERFYREWLASLK